MYINNEILSEKSYPAYYMKNDKLLLMGITNKSKWNIIWVMYLGNTYIHIHKKYKHIHIHTLIELLR